MYKILKIKQKEYSSHCRNCNFSDIGETYNIVIKAKQHALKNKHSVEYWVENGRVIKVDNLN